LAGRSDQARAQHRAAPVRGKRGGHPSAAPSGTRGGWDACAFGRASTGDRAGWNSDCYCAAYQCPGNSGCPTGGDPGSGRRAAQGVGESGHSWRTDRRRGVWFKSFDQPSGASN
jgi:hypothetical protein